MFNVESLYRYCRKYNIDKAFADQVIALFRSQPMTIQQFPPQYEWSKRSSYGYVFALRGQQIKIEMSNMTSQDDTERNNVTFVGFEGVNWRLTS